MLALAARCRPWILGFVALVSPALCVAQGHAEFLIGCDAAGQLAVASETSAPFPLPPSRFPGIDGYAEVFPGFSTALGARASADFAPVEAQAELVFVLVAADPGLSVWNDRGTATMREGDSFRLGRPPFDSHPVWNLRPGETGATYALRLLVRDTTGRYADSDVFTPSFAPDDATEVFVCPMSCRGGASYAAAGRCPECEMWLKLLAGRSYRVAVTVEDAGPGALESGAGTGSARAGVPATLRFRIESPQGEPVTQLEVVHEKLLHLLMVSNDLSWFSHEHPALQPDGSFLLSFSFPQAGAFTLYHDFTPPRVGQQVVPVELQVEGDAPAPPPVPLAASGERTQVVDGYTVRLTAPPKLISLVTQELSFRLERDGQPVTDLQPFLGTLGHLIVLSEDRRHFVHSHPLPPASGEDQPRSGPTVVFSGLFPVPGRYKAWGQFQHEERVLTAAFVLDVVAPH